MFVPTVFVVVVAAFVFGTLTVVRVGVEEVVASNAFNNNDGGATAVVVLGAWRAPDGELSRAFRERIFHAARVALLLGASEMLFTGGLNDGHDAMELLLGTERCAEAVFPAAWLDTLQQPSIHAAALERKNDLLRFGGGASSTCAAYPHWPRLSYENVSLTTLENAQEAHKRLQQVPHVVAVTSLFHSVRARLIFRRVFLRSQTWTTTSVRVSSDARADFFEAPRGGWLNAPAGLYETTQALWTIARSTLLSVESFSALREVGALAKALLRGEIGGQLPLLFSW